jgi:GDPmannose 4,6-dehydratase
MYMMMQQDTPSDWVLATGETHTVREFLIQAFKYVDIEWEKYIQTSEKYFRPNEVEYLLGDSTKANKILGWKPETSFDQLVELMVKEDLVLAEREKVLIENNLLKPTWENPTK